MNDFASRKLGEVLAFAQVGEESLLRGMGGFEKALGKESCAVALAESRREAGEILRIASEQGAAEAVLAKAERTAAKLRAMRELYLKEEDWNDPAELLEWSGFFEGAALVHWNLVRGTAEKDEGPGLGALADRGAEAHDQMLRKICEVIRAHGKENG